MSSKISKFQESLSQETVNQIFELIKNQDLSSAVLTLLKTMKNQETAELNSIINKNKSEEDSEEFRLIGNNTYVQKKYQDALILYNRAIVHSPRDSRAIKLALTNRSALLFKLNAYVACLKDIQKCCTMEFPSHIMDKLRKRREEVKSLVDNEMFNANLRHRFADLYFPNKIESNPEIPHISRDVKIVESVTPIIVASQEIKAGTVICWEKAYVSSTNPSNTLNACHYCQKMSLNLLPCNNCCSAMFCSEDCLNICYEEYHNYECQIIDAITELCDGNLLPNLMVKTVFKIRSKSNSWKEIIDESKKIGVERITASPNEEIFNSNYLFSVLNVKDDKTLEPDLVYKGSILVAAILMHIEKIPSFYPENKEEKEQALEALARIMIFFYMYQSTTYTYQGMTNVFESRTQINPRHNGGIFAFVGKLKKMCTPNLFAVNRNNVLMLIAIQNINTDEELTLSNRLHWIDFDADDEVERCMQFSPDASLCVCSKCTEDNTIPKQLSASQKMFCNSLGFLKLEKSASAPQTREVFVRVLDIMDVLKDVPLTKEYKHIFKIFRKCVLFHEAVKGENFYLDKS